MDGNPYTVLGARIARRVGRDREWQRVLSQIERNHLSIIGPKYIGKSVLLSALADHFRNGGGAFRGSLYWDLKHATPKNDEEFYSQFAKCLATTVRGIYSEYAAELETASNSAYKNIQTVLELLRDENLALLFCLDGWDHLLLGSLVTRNLLDNLRSLAEWPTVRLVTGSRQRLRELCTSRDARTSDFHNIFGNPLALAAFREAEIGAFLCPFAERSIMLGSGAQKQLLNWSGGIPVLLASLCRDLWDSVSEHATATKDLIDDIGVKLHLQEEDAVRELWDDCTEEQRALFLRVQKEQFTEANAMDRRLLSSLVDRGLLRVEGRGLKIGSLAIANFVAGGAGGRSNALVFLFGTDQGFKENAKGLLQLRLGSLGNIHSDLKVSLENAIANLENPKNLVRVIRGLVDDAFELIWDHSIPDRNIPVEWSAEWKMPDRDGNSPPRDPPEGRVPNRGGKKCQLLGLMTDPRRTVRGPVRRSTYVLVDGLQNVGDYGQHLEGEQVPFGFGIAICLSAIEMVSQLMEDLSSAQ